MKVTKEIITYLKGKDEIFAFLENKYGLIEFELFTNLFESIIYNIIGQMLSKKAATTVYNRFVSLCEGNITSTIINKLDREQLRTCGMAYSKADYILEFSKGYSNGDYDFSNLNDLSDNDLISYLRRIKGIGRWTAEMLALFSIGREDIFSYDDVALRNGIMKAKGYKTLSKNRFDRLRKKYTPYCSYASLYFYKVNDDNNYRSVE